MSKPSVLIIGAGAWGSSTAVSFLKSDKYTVTLIDRAHVLPAEDAASTDLNKIVRFDYDQEEYADLAFKALQVWRSKEWEGMYFECGTVVVAPLDHRQKLDECIVNVTRRCPDIVTHTTPEEIRRALDPKDKGIAGNLTGQIAYSNPWGGWVNAAKATAHLIKTTTELGGTVVPGAEAESWIIEDGDIRGVKCLDGREFRADKIIAASGAWMGKLMGDLLPEGLLVGVGITVAAFKLSEEEYERYKDIPVYMDQASPGFYSMPPTHDRMLKFGLVEAGFTTIDGAPRTTLTDGAAAWHDENEASWLPHSSFEGMRHFVNRYFPEFNDRAFDYTRMCPIPATFDDNFIIDYHPRYPSLLIASGGSHHSYKMMPVIGAVVQERLEGVLDPNLVKLWAIREPDSSARHQIGEKTKGRVDVEDVLFAGVKDVRVDAVKGIALSAGVAVAPIVTDLL